MKLHILVATGLLYLFSCVSSYTPKKCDIRLWHMEIMEHLFPKLVELTQTQMSALDKVEQMMERVQSGEVLPVTSCTLLNTYNNILLPDIGKEFMEGIVLKTKEIVDEAAEALAKQKGASVESGNDSVKSGTVVFADEGQHKHQNTEILGGEGDGSRAGSKTGDRYMDERDEKDQSDEENEDGILIVDEDSFRQGREDDADGEESSVDKHDDDDGGGGGGDDDIVESREDEEQDEVNRFNYSREDERETEDEEEEEEMYVLDAYGNFAGENGENVDAGEENGGEEDNKDDTKDEGDVNGTDDNEHDEDDNVLLVGDDDKNDDDEKGSPEEDDDGGVMIFYDDSSDDYDDEESDTYNRIHESKEDHSYTGDGKVSFEGDDDDEIKSQDSPDEFEDNDGSVVSEDSDSRTNIDDGDDDASDEANDEHVDDGDDDDDNDIVDSNSSDNNDMGNMFYFENEDDDTDDRNNYEDGENNGHESSDSMTGNGAHEWNANVDGKLPHSAGIFLSTLYATHCVEHNQFDPLTVCDNTCAYFYILLHKCDLVNPRAHKGSGKRSPDWRVHSLRAEELDDESITEEADRYEHNMDNITNEDISQDENVDEGVNEELSGNEENDDDDQELYDKWGHENDKTAGTYDSDTDNEDIRLSQREGQASSQTIKKRENTSGQSESPNKKSLSDDNNFRDSKAPSQKRAMKNEKQKTHPREGSDVVQDGERSNLDIEKIESILGKRESEQAAKIQHLELMLVKLENRILTHNMDKQGDSSAVIALENQILKLENELLKLNQSYHQLKVDHETLNSRHSSFVETHQTRPKYLALADNSSKEIMTQQQGKLVELQKLLQNQSDVVQKLHSRSELLEDQNRKLFEVVMNQTALISHIMSQMQELSEDGLRSKIQAEEFKSKLEKLKQAQAFQQQGLNDDVQTDRTVTRQQTMDTYDYAIDSSVKENHPVVSKDFVTVILLTLRRSPFAGLPTLNRAGAWCCNSLNSTKLCVLRSLVISNCTPFNDIHWEPCKPMFGSLIMDIDVKNNHTGREKVSVPNSKLPEGGQNPDAIEDHRSQSHRASEKKDSQSDVEGKVSKRVERVEKDEIGSVMPKSGEKKATDSEDKLLQRNDQRQHNVESDEILTASPTSGHILSPAQADKEETRTGKSESESKSSNDRKKVIQKGKNDYEYTGHDTNDGSSERNIGQSESHENKIHNDHVITQENLKTEENLEELEKTDTNAEKRVILPEVNKATDSPSASPRTVQTPASKSNETISSSTSSCVSEDSSSDCRPKSSETLKPPAGDRATDSSLDHSKDNLQQPSHETKDSTENIKVHAQGEKNKYNVEANDLLKITNGDELSEKGADKRSQQPNREPKDGADIPRNVAQQMQDDEAKEHQKEVSTGDVLKDGVEDKVNKSSREVKDGADIPRATSQQEKSDEVKEPVKKAKTEEEIKEMKEAATQARALHEALHRKILYEPLHSNRPKDCYELYKFGQTRSGMSQIFVSGLDVYVSVYCDMKNGGWTVLLKRDDGLVDFYRDYEQYTEGFGAPRGEHYIGNEVIHYLTNQGHYSLRAELSDWKGNTRHAHFDHFWIDGEDDGFELHISGYSGNAGDGLSKHNGMKFSTFDVDHDLLQKEMGGSCAKRFHGAGWFFKCYASNLMGRYYKGGDVPDKRFDGMAWKPWLGPGYSLKTAVLAIRPYGVER